MSPEISCKHFKREISFMRGESRPLVYVRSVENSHVLKMKWFLLLLARGERGVIKEQFCMFQCSSTVYI